MKCSEFNPNYEVKPGEIILENCYHTPLAKPPAPFGSAMARAMIPARTVPRVDSMPFFTHSKVKKRGLVMESPVNDDGRCESCGGACCSSFPSVDISWQEYERLRDLGACRLHFSLTGHHQLIIENGCEFLTEGRCAIYEHRPQICRLFFCRDLP